MSLLVVNTRATGIESRGFAALVERASGLVRRARILELPVAHLHHGFRDDPLALNIPIGRFDPIFASVDLAVDFPGPLIEFLVHSPSRTINLVGFIRQDQLSNLSTILMRAGFDPKVHTSALVLFDGIRAD